MVHGNLPAKLAIGLGIVAGIAYFAVLVSDASGGGHVALKGAGVALLAVYAALNARDGDGWLIAFVMACGAIGDVLIEFGLIPGAAAFAVGHLAAIALYLRHRRADPVPTQTLLGVALPPLAIAIAWLLTRDLAVAFYTLLLALMASFAWTSRFSRYRTGIGAMMFVASDLLIFARMDTLAGQHWATLAIWALYFAGQLLIVLGVVDGLARFRGKPVAD